jgi:hypothetical protein
MISPRPLLAVVLAALACAGGASADVRIDARDEPLGPSVSARGAQALRVLPARTAPGRFNAVGLHWRGSGRVWFRTAPTGSAWSAWRPARPEGEDRPDAGDPENRTGAGWKLGNPYWTGPAHRIQYRLAGRVTRLRAFFLWSPVVAAPGPVRQAALATRPAIVTRAQWHANERIVRGSPSYAPRLAFALVHHTAGSVPATPAQSAAIVRAIQAYHVRSNGWNDIGYNFVVDPFGQIFEGRRGGMAKPVVGAHAEGFNTGSVGIAVLGNYVSAKPSAAAKDAIARLLAWRLDVAHVDPTSSLTWTSLGSSKFPAGTPVTLKAVSGHKDVGLTACPGKMLAGAIGSIAASALELGGPKLFDARALGVVGGPVRFTGRLSESLAWTVTVLDAAGVAVASGTGTGTVVEWTWDSSAAPPGVYRYRMEAEGGVRPAGGPIAGEAPLTLARLRLAPAVVTPNGDGIEDRLTIGLVVSKAATLALRVENLSGTKVATVATARALAPGATTISWKARALPDGEYRLVGEATAGAERVIRRKTFTIDRTLGKLGIVPPIFSPNGDGRRETVDIGFTLARAATVRLRVLAGKRTVATLLSGSAAAGRHTLTWKGRGVADGTLRIVAEATTAAFGTRRLEQPLVRDTKRPVVTILAAKRRPRGGTLVRLRLSEPALLVLRLDRETIRRNLAAGVVVFRRTLPSATVNAYAQDAAANGASAWARVRG